jgi:hypothetical protein
MGSGEGFTMRNFIVCTAPLIPVRVTKCRKLRWAEHMVRMKEGRNDLKILTGTPVGKRPLRWPRRRWKEKIIMDLKEIDVNTRSWID